MYLLTQSGMNLDLAMEESAKVVSNKYLTNAIDKARKEVVEGKDFVQALTKTQIFPDIFILLSLGLPITIFPDLSPTLCAIIIPEEPILTDPRDKA